MKSNQHKGVYLHTQSFSREEVLSLCGMLNRKFNLSSHPVPETRKNTPNKVSYKLYISGRSYETLRALIFDYLIPSMHYKFPVERRISRSSK